ncbi:hypothetical protein [Sphingobium naphthae]|uniref:Uncharacterized protein n=1 Tax=Sphingobium naphthae TaxID=1886786 RepID=A0ABU3ZRG9_9SPHN|nr:hypothetical protein [Sphingobium naphthae]MCC4254749.1 hypothetical protein [Sphingobium naphthae]MDV5821987.1 hypothetical protein [Sphingobium naphthae]
MNSPRSGEAASGTSRYFPAMGGADAIGSRTVQILHRLTDGTHIAVWQLCLDSRDAAAQLYDWMHSKPERWDFWGRLSFRIGAEASGPLILAAAMSDEQERRATERERREREKSQARLASTITLYLFTPTKKRPYLGLERGNESDPFFVMKFDEKWERDRVSDWLAYQEGKFAEMERIFREFGQLALERHILAGMRATERESKLRGISAGGRRPLRFWRGE